MIIVVESEVAYIYQTSYFKLTEVLIDQFLFTLCPSVLLLASLSMVMINLFELVLNTLDQAPSKLLLLLMLLALAI